jgi:hypothetical protein
MISNVAKFRSQEQLLQNILYKIIIYSIQSYIVPPVFMTEYDSIIEL